jgi:hypothetical protein
VFIPNFELRHWKAQPLLEDDPQEAIFEEALSSAFDGSVHFQKGPNRSDSAPSLPRNPLHESINFRHVKQAHS